MTTELPLPSTVPNTAPGSPLAVRNWTYDRIPSLKKLLPKHAGRPGLEYLQCTVGNLRRAQDEGWLEVEDLWIYTIIGPKGEAHMKLLARGKIIPGQSTDSGARLCLCDRTVEALTGIWINPHLHIRTEAGAEIVEEVPDGGDTPTGVDEKGTDTL